MKLLFLHVSVSINWCTEKNNVINMLIYTEFVQDKHQVAALVDAVNDKCASCRMLKKAAV